MFERFTKVARVSVERAVVEAGELGHSFVGTEHLLLGLLWVREGIGYEVLVAAGVTYDLARTASVDLIGVAVDEDALAAIGIDLDAVRRAAEQSFGPGALDRAVGGQRGVEAGSPFTARAKKVFELSLREAVHLKQRHIGTEHLLLGLVREGDGIAAQVLGRIAPDADFRQLVLARTRSAS